MLLFSYLIVLVCQNNWKPCPFVKVCILSLNIVTMLFSLMQHTRVSLMLDVINVRQVVFILSGFMFRNEISKPLFLCISVYVSH